MAPTCVCNLNLRGTFVARSTIQPGSGGFDYTLRLESDLWAFRQKMIETHSKSNSSSFTWPVLLEKLDTLEEWVREIFSKVPNKWVLEKRLSVTVIRSWCDIDWFWISSETFLTCKCQASLLLPLSFSLPRCSFYLSMSQTVFFSFNTVHLKWIICPLSRPELVFSLRPPLVSALYCESLRQVAATCVSLQCESRITSSF